MAFAIWAGQLLVVVPLAHYVRCFEHRHLHRDYRRGVGPAVDYTLVLGVDVIARPKEATRATLGSAEERATCVDPTDMGAVGKIMPVTLQHAARSLLLEGPGAELVAAVDQKVVACAVGWRGWRGGHVGVTAEDNNTRPGLTVAAG